MEDVFFKYIVFSGGLYGVGELELDCDYFTEDEIKRQEELGNKIFNTKECAEDFIKNVYK